MDCAKKLQRLLRENNFELVRENKHLVYKQRGTGRIFVTSATPSDVHWAKMAIDDLQRRLAQPPRSEILTVAEYEAREKAIRLERQAKPKKSNGSGPAKSKGTGIIYITKTLPVVTEAEKEHSRQAARAAAERFREKQKASAYERDFHSAFCKYVGDFVWSEFEATYRSVEEPTGIYTPSGVELSKEEALEVTRPKVCREWQGAIAKLARHCLSVKSLGAGKMRIGLVRWDDLLASTEELNDIKMLLPFTKSFREDVFQAMLVGCQNWLDGQRQKLNQLGIQMEEVPEMEEVVA